MTNDILLPNAPTLVLCTRFALPATRERCLSMPEIGEKERDYLFTKLYRLSDLMSSLKILKSFRIPTNSQSFLLSFA